MCAIIPTCDVFCGLRRVAGTGLVIGYDGHRVVLATLHRRDEAIALRCGSAVLAICGQGDIVLGPLHRHPIHSEIQRPAQGHLDVDHIRA